MAVACSVAGACGAPTDDVSEAAGAGPPQPGDRFQWQLGDDPPDLGVDADTYDLDLFETSAAEVAALHERGVTVACYLSAGTAEAFRPDVGAFPPATVGNPLEDYPDERWLDVRRIDELAPVLEDRLDRCADKGFDAVEPDNVDAYASDSGFAITAADQVVFNRWLADAARRRGLSPGLKNAPDLVTELVGDFDWALVEQCLEFEECEAYQPFVDAGAAVFVVEYRGRPDDVCRAARDLTGMTVVLADRDLDGPVDPCP